MSCENFDFVNEIKTTSSELSWISVNTGVIPDRVSIFRFLEKVMGHGDSFEPSKMAIEGSATFPNGGSDASHAATDSTVSPLNRSIEKTPSTATDIGGKRKI